LCSLTPNAPRCQGGPTHLAAPGHVPEHPCCRLHLHQLQGPLSTASARPTGAARVHYRQQQLRQLPLQLRPCLWALLDVEAKVLQPLDPLPAPVAVALVQGSQQVCGQHRQPGRHLRVTALAHSPPEVGCVRQKGGTQWLSQGRACMAHTA